MRLSDAEVLDRINHPRNSGAIDLARNQEDRLLLHSENILEKFTLPFWAYRNFTLWWQSLITQEKHSKIEQLITTPLSSVPVVEEIFNRLSKFRDAQDRYVAFEFTNPDYTNDFNDYLSRINDDSFWRENILEALKTGINDVVVIDLPSVQTSDRPEPYQYLISPHFFVDIELNKYKGSVEYFIFKQSNFKWDSALSVSNVPGRLDFNLGSGEYEKIIAIDDDFYRVYTKKSGDNQSSWVLTNKIPHTLGYCPCIDFWNPSIKGTNGINKKGVLSKILSKLDKYLFYSALVDYMDIYGAFPIFVTYSMEDEEFDEKNKQVNFGDYYSPNTSTYIGDDKQLSRDPRKSYTWMGAPGSIIEYAQPVDKDDVNMVKDAPRFINMPVEALKHVNDRCRSLRDEIINYATGINGEYLNEIAKTKEMFNASFSEQDTILTFIKRQIERVHRFSIKTRAEIRYGKEYFLSCTVDYGSDYYLKDATAIVEEFKEASDAGMSPEYCSQIAKEAANTRFKNNPDVLARQRILRDVVPYSNLSIEDMITAQVNISDIENFVIRINAANFISQFELEFGDIVKFGKNLNYSDKIFLIKKQLKEYGKNINWKPAVPKSSGGKRGLPSTSE